MQKSKRFLPRRKSDGTSAKELTHEHVTQAIRAFQKRGGLISKLPPEPENKRTRVGHRWSSAYEVIFEQA
jgi:hypothetical protein